MRNSIVSSGFFAFLAMILIGVCAILLLNAPAQTSMAATNSGEAIDDGYEADPSDAPPVVDAQVERNEVQDHTTT